MLASAPRKYVNKRLVSQWEKSGKKKAIQMVKKMASEAKDAEIGQKPSLDFKTLVTELSLHAAEGNEKEVCGVLSDAGMAKSEMIRNSLVDVIWILSLDKLEEKMQKGLEKFAKGILDAKLAPRWMFHERLTGQFLENIGFGSKTVLAKKEIRARTRQLFAQRKFNLLREETEGYSKLIGEIFAFVSASKNARISPKGFLKRIQPLIGYFDLDPNRVMDLVLEGFELQLGKGKKDIDLTLVNDITEILAAFKPEAMCALIGFKFQFYQKEGRHKYLNEGSNRTITTPSSLLRMTAVLIASKKLKLEALWPYLMPSDETFAKDRTSFVNEKLKIASKVNVVNMNTSERERKKDNRGTQQNFGKNNQKVDLLYYLLVLGDWNHASKILNRLSPIFLASEERICRQLCELISRLVEPLYDVHCKRHRLFQLAVSESKSESKTREEGEEEEGMEVDDGEDQKVFAVDPTPSQGSLLPWEIRCPKSLDTLPSAIWPPAQHLGCYIYRDPVLFSKLCRIFREIVYVKKKQFPSPPTVGYDYPKPGQNPALLCGDLELVASQCIIPGFSLMGVNPGLTTDLWSFVNLLPYWERFRLYGYWSEHAYSLCPEMAMQRAMSVLHVRQFKKRISNSNIKDCGRLLVKCAFSNPLVAMEEIVQQISSYENLIKPVLESLKYFHAFTFDCLVYTLLLHFSQEKPRLSEGLNVAHWYKNLAVFSGFFFRKYPDAELGAIIQYIINRLKDEDMLDETCIEVVVLRELISHMAGIEAIEDLGEIQLEGQGGGPVLQSETATFRQLKNKKKPTAYLLDCLLDNQFLLPLLVLMSHCKDHIIYKTDTRHIELISELFDLTQGVLIQLGEFVQTHIPKLEVYAKHLPPLYELVKKFHLEPSAAFFIARPVLEEKRIATAPTQSNGSSEAVENKDEKMEVEDQKKDKGKPDDKSEALRKKAEAAKIKLLNAKKGKQSGRVLLCSPGSPLVSTSKLLLPEDTWNKISPEFYSVFWSLSMYDLRVPEKLYKSQIKKLKDQEDSLRKTSGDKGDDAKRKKERERCNKTIKRLEDELDKQKKNYEQVMASLRISKDKWLKDIKEKDQTGHAFVQHCVVPRLLLTPIDALYCARFLEVVLELDTPWLSMIHFYDLLLKITPNAISSCTSNEASRFGRFLGEILASLFKWKDSERQYKENCASKRGFAADFYSDSNRVSYGKFCQVVSRWNKLIFKSIIHGLVSSSRMHIRNTLYILQRISHVFPRVSQQGESLLQTLKTIAEAKENKNTAVAVLAERMRTSVEARKSKWKDKEFIPAASKASKATDRPTGTRKKLSAGSKPFKPSKLSSETSKRSDTKTKTVGRKISLKASAEERAAKRQARMAPLESNKPTRDDDRARKRRKVPYPFYYNKNTENKHTHVFSLHVNSIENTLGIFAVYKGLTYSRTLLTTNLCIGRMGVLTVKKGGGF